VGTYRLTVEYDGSEFHGWQRQPALRTAEGELRAALRRVVQDDVELTAAGASTPAPTPTVRRSASASRGSGPRTGSALPSTPCFPGTSR